MQDNESSSNRGCFGGSTTAVVNPSLRDKMFLYIGKGCVIIGIARALVKILTLPLHVNYVSSGKSTEAFLGFCFVYKWW